MRTKENIPTHVAIIMDGNRRWAKKRKVAEAKGHEAGAAALERTVEAAAKLGLKYLTVYALSTENLRERGRNEIAFLFFLMDKVIKEKLGRLTEVGVRLEFLGELGELPKKLRSAFARAQEKTRANKKLTLGIAVNYGGRAEIVHSVRAIAASRERSVSEESISANLYTASWPDLDLIIRTGGQRRLSNFLLWQAAYSELYFTDLLWPDFDEKQFQKAIKDYQERRRSFGR